MKLCRGPCEKLLPATTKYFWKHKKHNDGFHYWCKECSKQKRINYDLEIIKIRNSRYAKSNNKKLAARNARRRATLLQATPIWVDNSQLIKIYMECPINYEVDHIIPLNSPIVCGLHVPWNLQYLTRRDNRSKGNRVDRT